MEDNLIINDVIPKDHVFQISSEYYLEDILKKDGSIRDVLDLGCGDGNSLDIFRKIRPDIKWVGLDIEKSPESSSRSRTDGYFVTFDGVHIPFPDDYFDLIYCNQVLEHVRYPAELLKEVRRVLKPLRYFIGSTSHLEPYHSYSLWNYTPFGFCQLIEEANLHVDEIRPGIDGLTLIIRRFLGRPRFFSRWFNNESPFNRAISLVGKIRRKTPARVNAEKLLVCGTFCFLVRKKS